MMLQITSEEYAKHVRLFGDYRFQNYQGNHPDWKGRRTYMALTEKGTTLFIEGASFTIAGEAAGLVKRGE